MEKPEYEIIRFDASMTADGECTAVGYTPSGAECRNYCTNDCNLIGPVCWWVCMSEDCWEED